VGFISHNENILNNIGFVTLKGFPKEEMSEGFSVYSSFLENSVNITLRAYKLIVLR
jgi:hypothetical protein